VASPAVAIIYFKNSGTGMAADYFVFTRSSYSSAVVNFPGRPSGRLLTPHTNEPRDVPRYGALSLLQEPLHLRGIQQIALWLNVKFWEPREWLTGDCQPPLYNS
jgi:hypothetical protein